MSFLLLLCPFSRRQTGSFAFHYPGFLESPSHKRPHDSGVIPLPLIRWDLLRPGTAGRPGGEESVPRRRCRAAGEAGLVRAAPVSRVPATCSAEPRSPLSYRVELSPCPYGCKASPRIAYGGPPRNREGFSAGVWASMSGLRRSPAPPPRGELRPLGKGGKHRANGDTVTCLGARTRLAAAH